MVSQEEIPLRLTGGTSLDRQPVYSPDGERLYFASNRGGNTDVWGITLENGSTRRLTEDPGTDWDPAFSPDGQHMLWTSDRSGNFEIWMATADGRNPRQVSRDGDDAENPTMTSDGEWVIYNSAHPEKAGVWKIHPDGSGATRLVAGASGLPEVSPDGKYVLYSVPVNRTQTNIRVVSVAGEALAPFEIECRTNSQISFLIALGRARWLPTGDRIAFVCGNEAGELGIFVQDFKLGRDTSDSRLRV